MPNDRRAGTGSLPGTIIGALRDALCGDAVLIDPDLVRGYQRDEADLCPYGIRARPQSTREVAEVLRLAAEHCVPVVPQGARTGLAGAANATDGAIVLSLTGMDRILRIDPVNRIAVVQPGVINATLNRAVASTAALPAGPRLVGIVHDRRQRRHQRRRDVLRQVRHDRPVRHRP